MQRSINYVELVVGYKWVMFQMQYLQVLFEAAYFSEQFDTSFKKIGQKMARCRPKNWNPKICRKLVEISKKRHNFIILSHIKLGLVSIPMCLISRNWLKVSKVLKTSYKGESCICCALVEIFRKKSITL